MRRGISTVLAFWTLTPFCFDVGTWIGNHLTVGATS